MSLFFREKVAGAMALGMITYHPAEQDLFLNQFLPGMIEITSIMRDLPDIPDLSRVLLLHVMRKITGQVSNPRVLQETVGLVMYQLAHPRVTEGTLGVQPVLVEGPCLFCSGLLKCTHKCCVKHCLRKCASSGW